jgi:arylsulfatase A-like enzyme
MTFSRIDFLTCLLALGLLLTAPSTAQQPPNIIVILTDDMGFSDLGCYGGEIETPVLDKLAANGLRFSQFYNTARCCPTRASLLTGLYPHQAGIGGMTKDRVSPGYRGDLSKNAVTIAEVLKANGYQTFLSGKWHVTRHSRPTNDSEKANWPLQRGFDRFYGTIDGAGSFFDPSSLTRGNQFITPVNDPDYQPETYYYTDAIADNASVFIRDRDKQRPFFLYAAFTAAHWPLHALPEDMAKYEGKYDAGYEAIRQARYRKAMEMGVIDSGVKLSPTIGDWNAVPDKEWEAANMEVYAAMVDRLDQGIGKIVQTLEAEGELDNTLILYMHDNGGCAEPYGRKEKGPRVERGEKGAPMGPDELQTRVTPKQSREGWPMRRGHVMPGPADTAIGYGENWANVSNTPYRYYKQDVYEGGTITPLIAHWPAGIKARNEVRNDPGHVIDIMATCIDVAGAKYPDNVQGNAIIPLEGKSLTPAFEGRAVEREFILWEHMTNAAIRVGNWKAVAPKMRKNKRWELYDLAEDPTEMNDLSQQQPEKVKELKKRWFEEAKRTQILPWPVYNQKKSPTKKVTHD